MLQQIRGDEGRSPALDSAQRCRHFSWTAYIGTCLPHSVLEMCISADPTESLTECQIASHLIVMPSGFYAPPLSVGFNRCISQLTRWRRRFQQTTRMSPAIQLLRMFSHATPC